MGIRILSKKDLRQLVLYSPAQIDRMEKAGRFPKRVRLGPCRVGWVEEEVLTWLDTRLRAREIMTAPEQVFDPVRRDSSDR
jgi:prophage regulatory protein